MEYILGVSFSVSDLYVQQYYCGHAIAQVASFLSVEF